MVSIKCTKFDKNWWLCSRCMATHILSRMLMLQYMCLNIFQNLHLHFYIYFRYLKKILIELLIEHLFYCKIKLFRIIWYCDTDLRTCKWTWAMLNFCFFLKWNEMLCLLDRWKHESSLEVVKYCFYCYFFKLNVCISTSWKNKFWLISINVIDF